MTERNGRADSRSNEEIKQRVTEEASLLISGRPSCV
jgi:hypothetical protein